MEELISVIVPIYKVEAYLERCIGSIVNQTYKNLEIILVDDGSPDSCPDICDAWKEKDDRIKVIHKKNGGLSDARNAGMQIMAGTYISYIDSDDWVANDMYEKMMYAIKKNDADICECQFEKTAGIVKSNKEQQTDKVTILKKEEALKAVVEEKINPVVWNKRYKREIVDQLYFEKGKYNEDEFWTYQVLGNARKVIYTNKVLYAYRQQENSVMHSLNAVQRFQALEAKLQRHEYICKYMPVLKKESICNIWVTCLYQGQLLLINSNKDIWKELTEILKKYPIRNYLNSMSGKEKIWMSLADKSFYWTCYIRNLFKIGL